MNPATEGTEEHGPDRIPYINDPRKRPHPADREALEETDEEEEEEE